MDVDKRKPDSLLVNVKWSSYFRKQYKIFSKISEFELPYDQEIPLLRIQSNYPKIQQRKDICISMFIVVLLIVTQVWKQARCPRTDKWMKNLWYMCTMEYYMPLGKKMKSCNDT